MNFLLVLKDCKKSCTYNLQIKVLLWETHLQQRKNILISCVTHESDNSKININKHELIKFKSFNSEFPLIVL